MPIASGAAWSRGDSYVSQFSSRSSLELPPTDQNDESQLGARPRHVENGTSRNGDDFHDNDRIPSSIIRGDQPPPPSQMEHSAGGGQDDHASMEEISWVRQKCGEIVDDERGQLFILLLIGVNSIMYGVATFPAIKDNPTMVRNFEIADMAVLIIFTIESLLQISFNGFRRFFKDGWLVFDLVIVVVSWISVEIAELRALRVFRAFRFVTRVSVLRKVVVALLSIVPAMMAIFTLLTLIFYIFAVMFTALFKDMYEEGYTSTNYFGRLDLTLFTLFQILCLDEWSGIAYEVVEVYYWAWFIFVVFVVMSAFVVVNLLIAVICDALQILRTAEEAVEDEKERLKMEAEEEERRLQGGPGDESETCADRIHKRVDDMQKMIDDLIVSQETMARTIEYLSLALYAEREPAELGSIRENLVETMSEDSSNRGESVEATLVASTEKTPP